jgi:cytochrome c-type biogenesis protein CcmH/NrfG
MRADPMMDRYSAAAERQDWKSAAGAMQEALAKEPNNADYHSLYAYSLRRGGTQDMDQVFKHYNEALRLDPRHKGAHEYIGEAYLQVGNVAKAKEHLSALDKLCFFGCSEYSDLKKAIAEHEAKVIKQ